MANLVASDVWFAELRYPIGEELQLSSNLRIKAGQHKSSDIIPQTLQTVGVAGAWQGPLPWRSWRISRHARRRSVLIDGRFACVLFQRARRNRGPR